METIHYTPAKQVSSAQLVEDAMYDISYQFGFQLISAFQASFAIVLAFQVNDIVRKVIDLEHVSGKYGYVIPILIVCNMVASYLKEGYMRKYNRGAVGTLTAMTAARGGSAHHFYQK
jgi:hypothetical protein